MRHETSLPSLGQELCKYLVLYAQSLMTALFSTFTGQCSHADGHSLSMTEHDDCRTLGPPSSGTQILLEKGGQKEVDPNSSCPWPKNGNEESQTPIFLLPLFLRVVVVGLSRDNSVIGSQKGTSRCLSVLVVEMKVSVDF